MRSVLLLGFCLGIFGQIILTNGQFITNDKNPNGKNVILRINKQPSDAEQLGLLIQHLITTTTSTESTLYPEVQDTSPDSFPKIVQWIKNIDNDRITYIINSIGGISKVPLLTSNWRKNPDSPILLVFEKYPSPTDPKLPSFEVPSEPDPKGLVYPNNEPLPKIPFNLLIYIITHLQTPTKDNGEIAKTIDEVEDIVRKVTTLNYLINDGFKIDVVIKFNKNPNDPNHYPQSILGNSPRHPEGEPPKIPTILLILLKKYIGDPTGNQMETIIRRLQEVLVRVKQLNRSINRKLTINIKFKFIEHPNKNHGPTKIIVDSPHTSPLEFLPKGHLPIPVIPKIVSIVFRKYRFHENTNTDRIIERIHDLVSRLSYLNNIIRSGFKIDLKLKFTTKAAVTDPTFQHLFQFFTMPDKNNKSPADAVLEALDKPPRMPSIILFLLKRILFYDNTIKIKSGQLIWRVIDVIWRMRALNIIIRNGLNLSFRFNFVGIRQPNRLYSTRVIVEPPGLSSPVQSNVLNFFLNYLEMHCKIDASNLNPMSNGPTTADLQNIFLQEPKLSTNELQNLIKAFQGENDNNVIGLLGKFTRSDHLENNPFFGPFLRLIRRGNPTDTNRGGLFNFNPLQPILNPIMSLMRH